MIIELKTAERALLLPMGTWKAALTAAKQYGWRPMGTRLDDDPGWCRAYTSSDGQYLLTEDAGALATALLKADADRYGEVCGLLQAGGRVWLV